jgi:tRNA G18 (ribose-2'-O)-methylase SpoU
MSARGFFEIGIVRGKTVENVGSLWRSAYQMGAAGIFTVGRRYPDQASDTVKAYRHIPMREFATIDALLAAGPHACQVVGVEMAGRPLDSFVHPESAIYLLGAEDSGLSPAALARCQHLVSLPSCRIESYNVAVAGAIVMFDRQTKRDAWRAVA